MIILGILIHIVGSTCSFNYGCQDLDYYVCASKSPTESSSSSSSQTKINLNTRGCETFSCNRTYVENIFNSTDSTSVDCYEPDHNPTATNFIINSLVPCDVRNNTEDRNQTLENYKTTSCPGVCYSELGVESDCLCGFDGQPYCLPNKSSGVYDDFWNICNSTNNKIDNKTSILWKYVYEHFVDILTAPYCADDVFSDIVGPNLDYLIDFSLIQSLRLIALMIFL